ncbi:MAG: glycosyltransferase [Timaviella obliquedivisa GSE-PSE-MK23-08B]|jgi:GT2 family glycosyltransferase|nr:glycosyltransferase [Timaviella obliquedivisa GSE-PSE-MK23-08B]
MVEILSSDAFLSTNLSLSIVVPVHNGGESFRRCLASLKSFATAAIETIIVVDGGTDDSWQLAEASGAKVILLDSTGGPARARNLGAKAAQGDILFFLDADVTLAHDTLAEALKTFQNQPMIAALIGSYDDAPGAANFLSQYKNLFHHYTHQTGCEEASTFWGACGAVRREVFLAIGGFDESYRYPSIEDIELGYRLRRAGHRICLCKQVQVKHLKHWGPVNLLRAEIFYRALPWSELLWRDRQFVNDLNLQTSSRLSVVLTYSLLLASISALWWSKLLIVVGLASIALLLINWPVYRFFLQKRGLGFALKVIPWHWFYYFYSGFAFAVATLRYHLFPRAKNRFSQA